MGKESKKKSPTARPSSNTPSTTLHPPYFQMISEAISSLKDRTGSSQPAIAKFMEERYQNQLPPSFKKTLSVQLKKSVKSEKLVKVKNSYKVSAPAKVNTKRNGVKKKTSAGVAPKKTAKKLLEKAVKTKRLSQVKTPEALKKKSLVGRVKSTEGVNKKKAKVLGKRESKVVKPMPSVTMKSKKKGL